MADNIDDIVIQSMEDEEVQQTTSSSDKQIQVRFRPSPSAPHLPVTPEVPFAVPSNLARLGLSELVNHLVGATTPRAYEFLINNKFLRTSLHKYLLNHGLSGESEIVLEYIEATPPPEKNNNTPHPDWISSVDASVGAGQALLPVAEKKKSKKSKDVTSTESLQPVAFAATGCYDNVVRVWAYPTDPSNKGTCVLAAQGNGHSAPVKDVRVARPLIKGNDDIITPAILISASQDRTLRLWEFAPKETVSAASAATLKCQGVFHHHTGTVEVIETLFSPNRAHSIFDSEARLGSVRFLSGGYDSTIALWESHKDYELSEEEAATIGSVRIKSLGRNKARKIEEGDSASAVNSKSKQYRPIQVLEHHKGPITSICWPHSNNIYSAGYDYNIVHWDLSASKAVQKWSAGHVINAMDFSTSMNLIASGDQDGFIRFWDPRASGAENSVNTTPKNAFRASDSWVADVKWAPSIVGAPHILASAAYDGQVKFWDVRSSKPLHAMSTNSDRLYGIDWSPVVDMENQHSINTACLVGGTGKVLDRITWKINV